MNKSDRIAIIGGGFSGLLIAEGLKNKGYNHVTVFEKNDTLGGKLHTVWIKGKSYEIGAVFGLPAQKHMKAFMKAHGIKADGPKLARIYYDAEGHKIMQIPKASLGDFVKELDRLPDVLGTFKSLENENLGELEPALMVPFSKWCDMNRFVVLKSIYAHYFTSYGLGDIEVLPAVYVLKIMNYDNLMSFMELPEFCTWKEGVSSLIKAIEANIDDVRLSQNVKAIHRQDNNTLLVETGYEALEYDHVILAAPLNQFAGLFASEPEMVYFLNQIKYQSYSVYLFNAENVPKGCGCVMENLTADRRGHLVLWNSRWDQGEKETIVTVYAYDRPDDSREVSFQRVLTDLQDLGIQNPKLYQVKRWNQCPYVEPKVLEEGFYQKIEAMQGKENIYFAGEIMSTVSMENCLKHSAYFVNRFF